MVFHEVQADLEAQGYEVLPLLLPACAVNAPHRRDRIWFVAYANNNRYKTECESFSKEDGISSIGRKEMESREFNGTSISNATNTNCDGLQRSIQRKCNDKQERDRQIGIIEECLYINESNLETRGWDNFPIEPSLCGGNDGLPKELDGITFSKWKNESIKAYGNAIVPQVAYEIFKTINQIENEKRNPRP